MRLRSALMMALEKHINAEGWTLAEAPRALGVTRSRLSDLMRGRVNLFGLDALVNMLTAGGRRVEVHVAKAS